MALAIAIVSIVISVASIAVGMVMGQKNKSKLKSNLSELQITKAEEGQCIPLIYGDVRVPGNIDWYGNIVYGKASSGGGKGGGGSSGAKSYNVYCDAHFVLCQGKAELIEIYRDEEVYSPNAALTFNDGTTSLFYAYDEFANKMGGVCHLFFKSWFLGRDATTIPSLSFKMRRILPVTPLDSWDVTISHGVNPAKIVYDLLVNQAGKSIDEASFVSAAAYFHALDWGLNLRFDEQEDLSKLLEKIFAQVNMLVYPDNDVYYAKIIDTFSFTEILEADMKDFVFARETYDQVYNDFAANYVDVYNTKRTVRLVNEAVRNITGTRKTVTYELDGFNDLDSVKSRLTLLMIQDSYPASQVSFKTALKYYNLLPGDGITFNYANLGIVDGQFTILKILKNPFENMVEIQAREYLYNVEYEDLEVGTPGYSDIDFTPVDLTTVGLVQVRWGKYRANDGRVRILVLPCKETGLEHEYDLYYSFDNISYIFYGTLYTFAYAGTLQEDYPSTTYTIDDQRGILIDYDDTNYALDGLVRSELFTTKRLALIGTEIVKFQTSEDEGEYKRLLGVLRGDSKFLHSSGADILFCEYGDNIVDLPIANTYYFKICPRTRRETLPLGDATVHSIVPNLAPDPPTRLLAARSGSNIVLEIFPNRNINSGCGIGSPDAVTDTIPHPAAFLGSFLVTVGSDPEFVLDNTTYSFSEASEVTVAVKNQINGFKSIAKTITIGTEDGEYTV